ncbi:MAG: SDR family oxidoreductase [Candidatus Promineifilaceae bacterium]|nr:SDR family oxidoreductase [Candidatus Promineifilaceae bacterium]
MAESLWKEKVVIVTGASTGIGAALAYQLAAGGAWLALAARNREQLAVVAEACRGRGGRALVVPTDVSEEAACRALVERTVAEYGGVDCLINNAGISMWTFFEELQDLSPLADIMEVNYLGSVYPTYYALPHLKEARGRLVAISSLAGKSGVPTRSGYAASKHAQVGFFDTLRIELAGTGVSVTIAYPDFVQSEIRKRAFGADGRPLGESPVQEDKVMMADEAAEIILKAVAARRREVYLTTRGRLGRWFKLIAPGLVDRIARRAIERGR